jgi:1-deoxy-D-xylulose-5-phosphate reductoisomerase
VERLVLTASGGPFRRWDARSLADATPEQAVAHPNWTMGRRISVDSATLMNKALEVIEARWLFDLRPERIDVVVHPQSVIHSMVETIDGSLLAQLGTPDMRVPIAYALGHPRRISSGSPRLNLDGLQGLAFERPDVDRFPSLSLAWQVLRGPAGGSAVLNAANEAAVAAFLDRRIRFSHIHDIVAASLNDLDCSLPSQATLEDILDLDDRARRHASVLVERRSRAL